MVSAVDEQPINNFEGNAGTFLGGKNLGGQVSPVAFREFMSARRSPKARAAKAAASTPQRAIQPTRERMTKSDRPRRTTSGVYRAPAPIERLRDQGKLDSNPRVNLGMFEASRVAGAS